MSPREVDSLSRNLNDFSEGTRLFESYIRKIKGSISDKTILIVDDGDITKPCAEKLEGLCEVRDGSTGEIRIGYHTIGVTALTPEKNRRKNSRYLFTHECILPLKKVL